MTTDLYDLDVFYPNSIPVQTEDAFQNRLDNLRTGIPNPITKRILKHF